MLSLYTAISKGCPYHVEAWFFNTRNIAFARVPIRYESLSCFKEARITSEPRVLFTPLGPIIYPPTSSYEYFFILSRVVIIPIFYDFSSYRRGVTRDTRKNPQCDL